MEWNEIPEVNLYSDGGTEPNPGKGRFGVIMSYKGIKREFSQGYELTTNNRMKLTRDADLRYNQSLSNIRFVREHSHLK